MVILAAFGLTACSQIPPNAEGDAYRADMALCKAEVTARDEDGQYMRWLAFDSVLNWRNTFRFADCLEAKGWDTNEVAKRR